MALRHHRWAWIALVEAGWLVDPATVNVRSGPKLRFDPVAQDEYVGGETPLDLVPAAR